LTKGNPIVIGWWSGSLAQVFPNREELCEVGEYEDEQKSHEGTRIGNLLVEIVSRHFLGFDRFGIWKTKRTA
jgi:hypothetical protein